MIQQANEKLLKEAERSTNPTIHAIHNWLSEQNDNELFEGVNKEGRTMEGAISYCSQKASNSKFKKGNSAMVDDETVFGWVSEYFKAEKVENVKPAATVKSSNETNKQVQVKDTKKVAKKKNGADNQISLFEL